MKRYDLQAGDGNLYWDEDLNGEWVKFVDVEEQSQRNLNRAIDAETELRKAKDLLQEFCDRVDRGEVRSKSTYSKFMAFLK